MVADASTPRNGTSKGGNSELLHSTAVIGENPDSHGAGESPVITRRIDALHELGKGSPFPPGDLLQRVPKRRLERDGRAVPTDRKGSLDGSRHGKTGSFLFRLRNHTNGSSLFLIKWCSRWSVAPLQATKIPRLEFVQGLSVSPLGQGLTENKPLLLRSCLLGSASLVFSRLA